MKDLLRKDWVMVVGIATIIFTTAIIRNSFLIKYDKDQQKISQIVSEIRNNQQELFKSNPYFALPADSYYRFYKNKQKADKIEIKNYQLNSQYTRAKYTLKNNYDYEILITPELSNVIDTHNTNGSGTELLFYDFNQAYKILKPSEEINLEMIIYSVVRTKLSRDNFKAYRLIYKNDEKRTVIGYIKIGEGNE